MREYYCNHTSSRIFHTLVETNVLTYNPPTMSILRSFRRIMVLAPHTDDAEIGCGGTIAKLLEAKIEIFWVVFSKASTTKPFSAKSVLKELKKSAEVLGIHPQNLIVYDYQVRHLPEVRQSILQNLVDLKRKIDPDLILMPTLTDIHQDHSTVAQEGLRAFKHISILGYEDPWNHITFNSSSFIHLERQHILKKINALKMYKSQAKRAYMDEEFIESLARTRGVQIGSSFAEAFEVIRWIIH